MQLKKSPLVTIIACVCLAGAALLFGYLSYHNKDAPPPTKPEKEASQQPPLSTPSSQYEPTDNNPVSPSTDAAKGNKTAWQTYKPAASDSSNALPDDETGTAEQQAASEKCADAACAERVLAFLADPNNDEAAKVAMAKTWLKPETKEETLSLLQLLREAYTAKQYDLKDRLLQMLAGADSGESAEQLIAVLNGTLPDFSLQELPEDLQYEIKKAIRLNPDERIGKLLADEFINNQRPDETVLEAIQDVKRPDMVYQLALEADQRGDKEKVGELLQSLQDFADPKTLEIIIRLGKENILSTDEAIKVAESWADSHQENFAQDKWEAYLSDPDAGTTERAIAAAALAAGAPEHALAVLQKAYDNESDQNLRLYYEAALDRMRPSADNSGDQRD